MMRSTFRALFVVVMLPLCGCQPGLPTSTEGEWSHTLIFRFGSMRTHWGNMTLVPDGSGYAGTMTLTDKNHSQFRVWLENGLTGVTVRYSGVEQQALTGKPKIMELQSTQYFNNQPGKLDDPPCTHAIVASDKIITPALFHRIPECLG